MSRLVRVRWEYAVERDVQRVEPEEDLLARRGRDGWELAAVTHNEWGTVYYFKRVVTPANQTM